MSLDSSIGRRFPAEEILLLPNISNTSKNLRELSKTQQFRIPKIFVGSSLAPKLSQHHQNHHHDRRGCRRKSCEGGCGATGGNALVAMENSKRLPSCAACKFVLTLVSEKILETENHFATASGAQLHLTTSTQHRSCRQTRHSPARPPARFLHRKASQHHER